MSHDDIAMAMGIAKMTLYKHFKHELTVGAQEKRQEVIDAMYRAAKNGNVGAARLYTALSAVPVRNGEAVVPAEPRPAALGKKQQAQVDAVAAHRGTDWDNLLTPSSPVQ